MHYVSFIPNFFIWWYGRGIRNLLIFLTALVQRANNMFSVLVLLKTLFAPWKKMVQPRGKGLDGLKYWIVDNLISRGVGFAMRIILLVIFIFILALVFIGSALAIIFWFGMPFFVVVSFLYIFLGVWI